MYVCHWPLTRGKISGCSTHNHDYWLIETDPALLLISHLFYFTFFFFFLLGHLIGRELRSYPWRCTESTQLCMVTSLKVTGENALWLQTLFLLMEF